MYGGDGRTTFGVPKMAMMGFSSTLQYAIAIKGTQVSL